MENGDSSLMEGLQVSPEAFGMIGASPLMQALYKQVSSIARADVPVLITGESGTGKELVARAIHKQSAVQDGPLIIVNCAALPASLIQAELFGHEKGAFTGASSRRQGYIEMAAGGTLFLDEIGDLPLEAQASLLRFLQEKTIERLGSNKQIRVDARVIAATNVDLEGAVRAGSFRSDLLYRLDVLRLRVPTLRERGTDIIALAEYFVKKFSHDIHDAPRRFSPMALGMIESYGWPGNVREMMNCMRRAAWFCQGGLITPVDLGLERRVIPRKRTSLAQARERAERAAILGALRLNGGNIARAAVELEVSRMTLYRLMEKHAIDKDTHSHQ